MRKIIYREIDFELFPESDGNVETGFWSVINHRYVKGICQIKFKSENEGKSYIQNILLTQKIDKKEWRK